ncbi:proline-rich domain-containing protein [Actinomyces wuliandei]|uniref:proline-rich domain-containing protein n=1 Tax=Actinomyces wuliandei TaxID=2057743 RepID=UPI000FD98119|nr:hypothetical protein [Actinomyces wuliandei]
MASRSARRKSAPRGGARRRPSSRGAAPAAQLARVTPRRLERAVASLHLPYSLTPDKEVRVMVDSGVVSLVAEASMLRVGAWWLPQAPLSLEVPLVVVANGWNLGRGVPVAGVTEVGSGGALLMTASAVVPVGVGLSDAQLLHVVEDATEDCVGFLRHLEEVFPQTRFNAMAASVGLLDQERDAVSLSPEESAHQARELVERARAAADSDLDHAGTLLVGAMEHAGRAGLTAQDIGADELLVQLLERSVRDRKPEEGRQAAVGRRLLEGLRPGGAPHGASPDDAGESGADGAGSPVEAAAGAGGGADGADGHGRAGTRPGNDDQGAGPHQAVTAARVSAVLSAAGRRVAQDVARDNAGGRDPGPQGGQVPGAARGESGPAQGGGQARCDEQDGSQEGGGPQVQGDQEQGPQGASGSGLVVEVGEHQVQVGLEGDDLVVRSRWDAPVPGPVDDALLERALMVGAGWNGAGRVLGARVLAPAGDPEDAAGARTDEVGSTGAGAGGGAAGGGLAVEGYVRWCVASGASDSQLSHMLEAALVEVDYLARFCDQHVVDTVIDTEAGQAGTEPV